LQWRCWFSLPAVASGVSSPGESARSEHEGDSARLFDNTGGRQTACERVRLVNSPSVSHYKYRRREQGSATD
jgi:hypothetical protein